MKTYQEITEVFNETESLKKALHGKIENVAARFD
jgi:hypothetical protein